MKQGLYVGKPAKKGGSFKVAILDFKFWSVCDVKNETLNIYHCDFHVSTLVD